MSYRSDVVKFNQAIDSSLDRLTRALELHKYDDDQPRDEKGRWIDTGVNATLHSHYEVAPGLTLSNSISGPSALAGAGLAFGVSALARNPKVLRQGREIVDRLFGRRRLRSPFKTPPPKKPKYRRRPL
jgi:hypothetical protein